MDKLLDEGQKSAFLICDHYALRRYVLGAVPCFPGWIGPYLKSGYLTRGSSAAELAPKCGIPKCGIFEAHLPHEPGNRASHRRDPFTFHPAPDLADP